MIEWATSAVELFSANLPITLLFIFAAAVAEALFIVGALVPALAIFLTAGGLIGSGVLPFWPVFFAAAFGALCGDLLTYWVGGLLEHRIKSIWPFSRYIAAIEEAEAFFLRHGALSILIGRFIPGVKSVVPAIAAIAGMKLGRFALYDAGSAIIWAASMLLPAAGITFGVETLGLFQTNPILATALILVLIILVGLLGRRIWQIFMARNTPTGKS